MRPNFSIYNPGTDDEPLRLFHIGAVLELMMELRLIKKKKVLVLEAVVIAN